MAMPLLLANILGGIGQGIGGAGQALEASRKEARQEAATAEQQRHNRAMEQYQQDANIIELPVDQVPVPFRPANAAPGATVRMSKNILPLIQQFRTDESNRAAGEQVGAVLRGAAVTPGTPTERPGALDLNENPEAAGTMPAVVGTPPKVDRGLMALANAVPYLYKNPEAGKAVMDAYKQARGEAMLERFTGGGGGAPNLPPGASVKAGDVTLTGQTPQHVVKQIGNREVLFILGPDGKPISQHDLGDASSARGVYNRQDVENQVNLEHTTKGSPYYGKLPPGSLAWQQRYNDLAKTVPVQPGGAIFGAGTGLTQGAPSQGQPPPQGQPQASLPTGQPLNSRAALPNPGEREDMAAIDSARTMLVKVRDALKTGQLDTATGGVFKNPEAAMNRTTEEYLGFGMTDEQRKLRGILSTQLQAIKHALIGATRTRPELADIAAAIPDEKGFLTGDTAEQMVPKIDAIIADLDSKRGARENVMGSTGVAVPSRPAAPSTAPQTPVVKWGRDAKGRPVPLK